MEHKLKSNLQVDISITQLNEWTTPQMNTQDKKYKTWSIKLCVKLCIQTTALC